MTKDSDGCSAAQRRAIAELLAGSSRQSAAAAAHVNVSTLYRWLTDPDFTAELRSRQNEIFDQATAGLFAASKKAIKALERNLTCGKPMTEVRAAQVVLTLAIRARENEVLERVERLESVLLQNSLDAEYRAIT